MKFYRIQDDVVNDLDKCDFSHTLNECIDEGITDLRDLSNILSQEFGSKVEELIDELDIGDFCDYLSDRYNIGFRNVMTYVAYRYSDNEVRKREEKPE